ncbi:MAG: phosphatidate cytidylyltransferase [Pseudomonadales bacterium]|nr:phosphatidate cytidylyltransferase [Pseudomonadales bacterium]MCP5182832.1 phosphatidate cytidylyltransferase [Pseudomonadales bacterium]
MLRTRIITALILAPVVIAAIYLLPSLAFAGVFWVFMAAGAWEWAPLARCGSTPARVAFIAACSLIVVVLLVLPDWMNAWLQLTVLGWGVAIVAVLTFPASGRWVARPLVAGALGLVFLPGVLVALVVLHMQPGGAHWVLFGLLVCWAADIGAYFAGRAFGRRKLAPGVSPGKTWEGAIGGLLLALVVCGGALAAAGSFDGAWLLCLCALVVVSVFGDLFESLLKRVSGVKDSGHLLPGHGGILDRMDSVLAVMPALALLLISFPVLR